MKCLAKKRRYRYYYFVTTCKDLKTEDIVIKENYCGECAIFNFINNLRKKYDNKITFGTNVQDFEESYTLDDAILVFDLHGKIYFVTDIIELTHETVTNGITEYDRVFLPSKDDFIKKRIDEIVKDYLKELDSIF